MVVRLALPSDDAAVRAVHEAAFGRANEASLVGALRREGAIRDDLSFVYGSPVAGSVVVSVGWVGGVPVPAVGPVGVLPAWQRQGVGTALLHAVVGAADALGEQCLVLLGSTAYYGRFGFGPAAPLVAPDPAWGEHFQVRRLTAWDGSLSGAFAYAAAFSEVEG